MRRLSDGLSGMISLLGLGLVFLGGAKLNDASWAVGPLGRAGISADLTPFVAWGEIIIGAMLAHRPLQTLGSRLLLVWMLGAALLHVLAADLVGASVPLALAILAALVVWRTNGEALIPPDGVPTPLARFPEEGFWPTALYLFNRIGLAFMFRWAVGGPLFWMSLPFMGLAQAWRGTNRRANDYLHAALLYLLFFGFGVGGIWNFVGHFFMSDLVAASTGWPAGSPFQHELAFYHLGSGVVGTLCLWWRDRFWLAAGLVPSVFAYGAAIIHVREFLQEGNVAPANWGFGPVGANLIIPSVVLALLAVYLRRGGFARP